MLLPGITFLLVSQLKWKNILLLNAYEEGQYFELFSYLLQNSCEEDNSF